MVAAFLQTHKEIVLAVLLSVMYGGGKLAYEKAAER